MKYSDILERHVYTVDFDPVERPEFDGRHLTIVLKKNNDNKTVTVVPLTRSSNGEGKNKYNIKKIASLPDNLKNYDSYVVYNQVRTVNCNRIMALKDNSGNRLSSFIDDNIFIKVLSLCFDNLTTPLTNDEKVTLYYKKYIEVLMVEVINLSYEIKKLITSDFNDKEKDVEILKLKIISLINNNIRYTDHIENKDLENGIKEIIDKCLDDTIIELLPTEQKIS